MRRMLQGLLGAALILGSVAVTTVAAAASATVADLDSGITPADLVETLLGPNVTATNVVYTGANMASGRFDDGAAVVGFDDGIVLSSGNIADLVPGPNESDGTSMDTGTGNDPDLDALVAGATWNATVLEFDFSIDSDLPTVDLSFQYVFGSEEYNEYVNSSYNDVFGFFVDGENCATVGDPAVPVSINTINNGNPFGAGVISNPDLYRNNDLEDGGGSIDTELDGLTTVLTCSTTIATGGLHHVKLAIADRSDSALDSAVLLQANSFTFVQDTVLKAEPAVLKAVPGAKVYAPNLTARLTATDGTPLADKLVSFSVGGSPVCVATTNANGVAACSGAVNQTLAVLVNLGYDAAFAGDGPYRPSTAHGPIIAVGGLRIR